MSLAPFSEKHTPKKILVSCAGLGMGNASRISAILEALHKDAKKRNASVSLHVISWGAGYLFLKHFRESCGFKFELIEIKRYDSFSLGRFISTYFSNTAAIKEAIRKINPDLMILDSDYHLLSWMLFSKPKISIAQARDVVDRVSLHDYNAEDFKERLTLFVREELDAFFQKQVFDKVLIPSFYPSESKEKEIKIPLIVREEFLEKKPAQNPGDKQNITVLLSGSEIDRNNFLELKKYNFKIISPGIGPESILSRADDLDHSDIIFTQGGLSSISEALARKKFLVVFPMSNHPEQELNSREVERHKAGLRATVSELQDLEALMEKIKKVKTTGTPKNFPCDGARVAAGIIREFLA